MIVLLDKHIDKTPFVSYVCLKQPQGFSMKNKNPSKTIRSTDWKSVVGHTAVTAGITLLIGAMVWMDLDRKRAFYTPGESLSKKERAAVDSMHDPRVEEAKEIYNKCYQSYIRLLPTIKSVHDWYNKPLPSGHMLPTSRVKVPTMSEYLYFLKDFEQKAVEKFYCEAYEELQKQK